MAILTTVAVCAALAVLVYVSVTDIRERRIPNKVMFPALAVALTVALSRPERWSLLLGGLLAGALLLLPTFIYGLERAGGGDVKLALFIGLLLGWPGVLPALFIAFAAACLFALGGMLLRRINVRSVIAFGPFLALGAVVVGAMSLLSQVTG
jgi:prepilin signal peptidase PulO-like enzyme (type II secretory pathway)